MKITKKLLSLLSLVCLMTCAVLSGTAQAEQPAEFVDYASQLTLNMASETKKAEVTVKTFVDGDTTHFNVDPSVIEGGVIKARYLAVNTPEVTGKIEEYGKKAASFTREKLSGAVSIIIESDNGSWNLDSTGARHLVWVWYKPAEDAEYRCLNLEILQNGLCIANSTANNRYGSICSKALTQAREQKLNVYSGQPDPDFYYGEAIELTLKELRANLEAYNGMKVAFKGVITMNNANAVYIEEYDPETDMYYGMSVYYGYGMSGTGLGILKVGNEARIVGTLQYYEAGGTWQVSDLTYRMMRPKDPGNIQKLSEGHAPAYVLTSPDTFVNGQVAIESEEASKVCSYAELAVGTSIEMKGLLVKDAYTTVDEDSSSYGAMTLTCEADGLTIPVRTIPLYGADGALVTQDMFVGQTIDVKGIVDYYDGHHQIKVFTMDSIIFHE